MKVAEVGHTSLSLISFSRSLRIIVPLINFHVKALCLLTVSGDPITCHDIGQGRPLLRILLQHMLQEPAWFLILNETKIYWSIDDEVTKLEGIECILARIATSQEVVNGDA